MANDFTQGTDLRSGAPSKLLAGQGFDGMAEAGLITVPAVENSGKARHFLSFSREIERLNRPRNFSLTA
jgi:hypothetical protein